VTSSITNYGSFARGEEIIARCRQIAACTDHPGGVTRTFLSPSMHQVHELLRGWMQAAGMTVQVDAAGNLRGLLGEEREPRLIIGSHLDTVPDAGTFDGILGVVLGLALVEQLRDQPLPFSIEVIGFSEEEGVRFIRPFLGSLALVGKLDSGILALKDAQGVSVEQAIRDFGLNPANIPAAKFAPQTFAYVEFHIEQGPVLESENRALGVIEAIVGQSRRVLSFIGNANHAGTTPMHLRHDAMAAAAEWIVTVEDLAVKRDDLVATVGRVDVRPGAGNVIAGAVDATLDLRSSDDAVRQAALDELLKKARAAAEKRGVELSWRQTLDQPAVPMDAHLTGLLEQAVRCAETQPLRMVSGAGHDAMIVAASIPSCMLFLRTPGGTSHHPSETVLAEDVEAALNAGLEFLKLLAQDPTQNLTQAVKHRI
jgi:allantoate deiminase